MQQQELLEYNDINFDYVITLGLSTVVTQDVSEASRLLELFPEAKYVITKINSYANNNNIVKSSKTGSIYIVVNSKYDKNKNYYCNGYGLYLIERDSSSLIDQCYNYFGLIKCTTVETDNRILILHAIAIAIETAVNHGLETVTVFSDNMNAINDILSYKYNYQKFDVYRYILSLMKNISVKLEYYINTSYNISYLAELGCNSLYYEKV